MELINKDIKEISLVTNYIFYGSHPEKYYSDKLRISNGWFSYKRKSYLTNKEVCSWSYKTSSGLFESDFEELVYQVYKATKNPPTHFWTDRGDFNIRVTFKDDTHMDLGYSADFIENGLEELGKAFLTFIPTGELYPDFINIYSFINTKLDKSNLKELKKGNMVALMYAEGGAMGEPGMVQVLDEESGCLYIADTLSKECGLSQIEIIETLFDGFEYAEGLKDSDMCSGRIGDREWIYLNLGCGNHLFLRRDFYKIYGNKIFDATLSLRYRNWIRLTQFEKLDFL